MAFRVLDHRQVGRIGQPCRNTAYTPLYFEKGGAPSVQAVVEISYSPSGELPKELLRQAYIASQFGTVVFVLVGPTASEIDAILDDLVLCLPLDIPGIKYVDIADETSVLKFVVEAAYLFAPVSGGTLRPMLEKWKCDDVMTLSAARAMFDERSRRARHGGTLRWHL